MDQLSEEVRRRRTFAIISHPDAGKTTLTEKLLLYGGAIHLAGSVKARRTERHATSDWMKMEQERGISVTSSVLQFEYLGRQINLLDTPGHADFSEDTYRTLIAADSAVMLLDNRKGVEERTRQLFQVCHRRRTPIFTFVNKCDRAGMEPLQLLDDVERDLGLQCYPITWPDHRRRPLPGRLRPGQRRRSTSSSGAWTTASGAHGTRVGSLDDPALARIGGAPRRTTSCRRRSSCSTWRGWSSPRRPSAAGEVSPAYFGSALTNFGVEPFLALLPRAGAAAGGARDEQRHRGAGGRRRSPASCSRSRRTWTRSTATGSPSCAWCSGRFEAGMQVKHVRTGKHRSASPRPTQFLARDRTMIEEAWPGDVIGIHDRGTLRIGDTLSRRRRPRVQRDPALLARALRPHPHRRPAAPQAARHRAAAALRGGRRPGLLPGDPSPAPRPSSARWACSSSTCCCTAWSTSTASPPSWTSSPTSTPAGSRAPRRTIERLASGIGRTLVYDSKERPLVLFESEWSLRTAVEKAAGVTFHEIAP